MPRSCVRARGTKGRRFQAPRVGGSQLSELREAHGVPGHLHSVWLPKQRFDLLTGPVDCVNVRLNTAVHALRATDTRYVAAVWFDVRGQCWIGMLPDSLKY